MRHLLAVFGLLLFNVLIHLSLLFSAGQGMCQVVTTECLVMGLQEN